MNLHSNSFRFLIIISLFLVVSLGSVNVLADSDKPKVALDSHDVVSYFAAHKAQKGTASFEKQYNGLVYRFVSKQNMELFTKNPTKYLPQFDGYCAYGVQNGTKAKGDPEVWVIVDGKLYFTGNKDSMSKWKKGFPDSLKESLDQWELIKDIPEKDL